MPAVCGLDWASEHHDFCIQSPDGELLLERRVSHDEAGVRALLSALAAHHVEAVAIERPDGLLVARLLDAGDVVIAMHPNQVAAARDRFRAAAGKSDRFDARVLCELARTDRYRFPALAPLTDDTQALRCLLRCREDLVATRVALANQLRATLGLAWPGPISLFADIDSPIALAFLARYPPTMTRAAWAPSACKASWTATATAADAAPSTSSTGCAARPPRRSGPRTPKPPAPPCSHSAEPSSRSSRRSRC
jgi:hypothetical protein